MIYLIVYLLIGLMLSVAALQSDYITTTLQNESDNVELLRIYQKIVMITWLPSLLIYSFRKA